MRRIAYFNGEEAPMPPQTNIPSKLISHETSSSTESAGRNGVSLIEATHETLDDNANSEGIESKIDSRTVDNIDDDLSDYILFLSEELSKDNKLAEAYLLSKIIKKFANSSSIDYTDAFNELLVRINASDIATRHETLKTLTKIFNKTVATRFEETGDLSNSKRSALKKVLTRAVQYISKD